MISSGINLVTTVIGFGVSTLFIVFICARLICARIQLSASRRSVHVASRADLHVLESGLQGIESAVVASFPTEKYTEDLFSSPEDTQCAVCLSEYNLEEVLRILPNCGHSFHASCVDRWLQQHTTCPVCRVSHREISDKNLAMRMPFGSALRACHAADPRSTESGPRSSGDRCEITAPEGVLGMDRYAPASVIPKNPR
ncbi:hypothetical protein MLD38_019020 [Melastoma candidum]|uniref:Uncharacterized protein n=1 Tax=Melastoma candidum TaxID=119954 RepID=A0ACB9QZ52_9MYRT|nr:hypothetical protein MLD38_019020 [Melastoma candidum]